MNEVSEVNGKNLDPQPVPPQDVPGRKYCDTCKNSQLVLAAGNGAMICRAFGPTVVGGVVVVTEGGQQFAKLVTETRWPGVCNQDWCPKHEPDPRQARAVVQAQDSPIARA